MISSWTDHIKNDEEKHKYIQSIKHARWVLDDLSTILSKMEKGLDTQELSPRAYDSPNWDYRQAHANGFKQCLRKIQSLLTLDQKDNNG